MMGKITIAGNEYSVPYKQWNTYNYDEDARMVRQKCEKCGEELLPAVIDFSERWDMEDLSVKGFYCLECGNLSIGNEQKKRLEEIAKIKGFSL